MLRILSDKVSIRTIDGRLHAGVDVLKSWAKSDDSYMRYLKSDADIHDPHEYPGGDTDLLKQVYRKIESIPKTCGTKCLIPPYLS